MLIELFLEYLFKEIVFYLNIMNKNNICFCIPARHNSTRLYQKLLLKFYNESCIQKTVKNVLKSKYFNNNIYVLTDNELIKNELNNLNCNVIMTLGSYNNGSERISKNLDRISSIFEIIVNIQADEPFISYKNIDEAIDKHLACNNDNIFYTTLHEEDNSVDYLNSTASLKVVSDINNNVLYYSRNIIPWNKKNEINKNYTYKTFTGIYVFNRKNLEKYADMNNTELQNEEDCEQLKIIENGYRIKTYPTIEYNEISLNTMEDYKYLLNKYK